MKKNKTIFSLALVFFLFRQSVAYSQIGAEAQGGKTTMWLAVGLDNELSKRWLSVTDLGYGRHSDPNNYELSKRLGLNVITQDFVYRLNEHWDINLSFGYWRRNFYEETKPYDEKQAPYQFRNELRPYQRLTYLHDLQNIKLSHTLRVDYRFYYDQDFKNKWTTPFEFRLRYLEKWKFPLSKSQKDWFIVIDEVLTSIDRNSSSNEAVLHKKWSAYQLTENRLSFYYRRMAFNKKIDLDFGIMHQYWRENGALNGFTTSFNLMIDLIIRDPFSKNK